MSSEASAPLPPNAYQKGRPLPADRFADVGKCQSTGRDITICYNTFGDPTHPCLLMAMGLGQSLLSYYDAFCTRLANAGFYVVRFDNRDVGLSTHLDGLPTTSLFRLGFPAWLSFGEGQPPYTLVDMARDAFGLLDQLGIDSAHLLGCSMGGMIVQCMAIQAPERARSLTIISSHSGGPHVVPMTWGMRRAVLQRPKSNAKEDVIAYRKARYPIFSGGYPMPANYFEHAEVVLGRAPEDREGQTRQSWAIQRAAGRDEGLQGLKGRVPTLIIHGMRDTTSPYQNAVHLAEMIEGSKLVLFPRMGHTLPAELYDDYVAEIAANLHRRPLRT